MLSARPGPRTSMCTCAATLRQEHRRLPGRVAAADDGDLLAVAELRLEVGGAVVDARALEARAATAASSLRYCAPVAMTMVRVRTTWPSDR